MSATVGVPGVVSVAMMSVMASLPDLAPTIPGAAWVVGLASIGVSLVSLAVAVRFRAGGSASVEEYVEKHLYLMVAGFFAHPRPAHAATVVASLAVYGLLLWRLTGLGPMEIGAVAAVLALFLHVSIWKHEVAHALAARLLGMEVLRVSVGTGPKLLDLRLGKTKLLWHFLPVRGGVIPLVHRTPDWRVRWMLLSTAGPAVELGGLLILLALWNTPTGKVAHVSWVVCTLVQALLFVANVVPSRAGAQHTDGFAMWNALRFPASMHEFLVATTHAQRALFEVEGLEPAATVERLRLPGRSDDYGAKLVIASALEKLEELSAARTLWSELARDAPAPCLAFFAVTQRARVSIRLGELDGVRDDAQQLLAWPAPRSAVALAVERLGYTALAERQTELLHCADGWFQQVLDAPATFAARSALEVTHAAIGFELGRLDEARPVLRRWQRRAVSADHRALAALYLAVAARRDGRRAPSRLVAEARALRDAPKLLAWFESEADARAGG